MKIWIKLLIGSILGIALSFLIPTGSIGALQALEFISGLVIKIGRYALFPLIFFSVAVGTFELKKDKGVAKLYGRTVLYLLGSTVLLVIIGTASVVAMSPDRIPIIIEEEIAISLPSLAEILSQLFPTNAFAIFSGSGSFLLPIFFLAFLLGLNFTFDRLMTRPAVQFFDSMSRIFYHINSFVLEIIGVGMIAVAAFLFLRIRSVADLTLFKQLIIVLTIDSAFIVLVLYPGLHYLLGERTAPYRWLYAILGPAVAGLISGDSYFALSATTKHGKENQGIPRSVGSVTFPLFAMFGKAGTALVSSVAFVVVLKSYSSLGLTFPVVLWIIGFTVLISFFLSPVPGSGAFIAVSLLCGYYGRGLEEGYLILKQAAPILICIGVFLDVITAGFASMLIAKHEGAEEQVDVREFI